MLGRRFLESFKFSQSDLFKFHKLVADKPLEGLDSSLMQIKGFSKLPLLLIDLQM